MTARRRGDLDDPERALRPGANSPNGPLGSFFGPLFQSGTAPAPSLPYAPGSDTSALAAAKYREDAAHLRRLTMELYTRVRLHGVTLADWADLRARGGEAESPDVGETGLTPDEAAWLLGRHVLSIRPRASQLYGDGNLDDTGARRKNERGNPAHVLRAKG